MLYILTYLILNNKGPVYIEDLFLGGMKEGLGVKRTDQREPSHHLFGPLLAL